MKASLLKKYISFILLILILIACQSPAPISGKIEGILKKDLKIYLIQPENLKEVAASYFGKVIDSAVVNSDGSFKFYHFPKSKEPILLELALQLPDKYPTYLQTENTAKSNYMPILWQSGNTIRITAKIDEFQKSFSIENPSKINKTFLELRDINQKAYQTYLKDKNWDVHKGDQLLQKEHAILQYQQELINFADSTELLMPALLALRWVSPVYNYERVPEFLVNQCNKWKEKAPNHPWVKQLCEQSESSKLPVLLGDKFPNIKLPMITKDTLNIEKVLGNKLTIIDLWASWCAPCRKENREFLLPIYKEYHKQGLQIIAYGLESDEATWKAAINRDGANIWLHTSELQGDNALFLKQIRISTIPANFILNNKGIVIAKNIHGNAIKDWVKNYMKNN
ncbi:TlpA disulfide reductase family protein [Polaribacter sp. Q13]|uniref:TlpA family protein disulfide reductase n=1 Tax=Polaribacter sp. Q13 TaxID=2806551 RepID=UPI00193B5954|nr:TlpA disulfide reductase family protein [Polaribacter sp. Q13]QVY66289.1 TlpA family protein disulfide reductase [Polaribacter sp. Q13]